MSNAPENELRGVSTSEVANFTSCQTKWRFAHHPDWNLEPVQSSRAILRGIDGHKALEAYYKAIKEGQTLENARKLAGLELMAKQAEYSATGNILQMETTAELITVLGDYFDYYENDTINSFRILDVEGKIEHPLAPGVNAKLVGRIDIEVEHIGGELRGQLSPIDHKFLWDFWSDRRIKTNAQMPNYIAGMRKKYPGALISTAIVNQIRYRGNAKERYARTRIVPTNKKINGILVNHSVVAQSILRLTKLRKGDPQLYTTRTSGKQTCDFCDFEPICTAELEGRDVSSLIKLSYQKNSYGYEAARTDE